MFIPARVTDRSLPGVNLRTSAAITKLYPKLCWPRTENSIHVLGSLAHETREGIEVYVTPGFSLAIRQLVLSNHDLVSEPTTADPPTETETEW